MPLQHSRVKEEYMKKLLILLLSISILLHICGCSSNKSIYSLQQYQLKISELSSPQKIGIQSIQRQRVVGQQDNLVLYKIPQIATVFTDNENSEILALFYDKNIMDKSTYYFKIYSALYLLKAKSENISVYPQTYALKIAEPENGYQIISADFNDKWLAWVETNKVNWKILLLDRTSNKKSLVAQGKLLEKSENDLPHISLDGDRLVYNDNKVNISNIVLINLPSLEPEIIYSTKEILGKPIISESNVVWHGERDQKSLIYHYNTVTAEVKQLTEEYAVNPYVWKDYVAWLETNPDDNNYVSLYNLKKGIIEFTTELKVQTNFSPTISNNVMIFPDETGQNPRFYFIKSKRLKTLHELVTDFNFLPSSDFKVHNSWISWYPQEYNPHPGNRLRAVGTYLLSIDSLVE